MGSLRRLEAVAGAHIVLCLSTAEASPSLLQMPTEEQQMQHSAKLVDEFKQHAAIAEEVLQRNGDEIGTHNRSVGICQRTADSMICLHPLTKSDFFCHVRVSQNEKCLRLI